MSDGIAEMNKAKTYEHTDGKVYSIVKGDARDSCNGCDFYDGMCKAPQSGATKSCGHYNILKLQSPLDTASAELASQGRPLVAESIIRGAKEAIIAEGVRTFDTGATRDTDEGKPRFHAYTCPLVEQSYGNYMLKHQKQSDGTIRPADNWKKRMPLDEVLESLIRHVKDLELHHDGYVDQCREKDIHEVLNGCKANINFYHHGILQDDREGTNPVGVEVEKSCDTCRFGDDDCLKTAGYCDATLNQWQLK